MYIWFLLKKYGFRSAAHVISFIRDESLLLFMLLVSPVPLFWRFTHTVNYVRIYNISKFPIVASK